MRGEGKSGGIARSEQLEHLVAPPQEDRGAIELGTVGWDDRTEHFETNADADDGVTLVMVTLFRGRDPREDFVPDRAQGHKVLARISAPLFYIPAKGAQVLVARPAGFDGPGLWHIFAVPGASPSIQFDGKRAKMDFGSDTDVVIKGKSVTLSDYSDRYLTLGPTFGFKIGDADANGLQLKGGKWMAWVASGAPPDAKATLKLSASDISIALKGLTGVSTIQITDGLVAVGGQSFSAITGNVALGAGASPVGPAVYGPYPGLPSTTVFIQP